MREVNLFISHSWRYGDAYDKLLRMLNNRGYFSFKNYSVPQTNPITGANSDKALAAAIEAKMRPCSVVLMMAGVYSTYSKWINKEIEIAESFGKPIVAIKPWGSEKISQVVRNAATCEAAWNTESIVAAIRRCL